MTTPLPHPVTYGPITRTDLVRYAGASGDFNPLHHDPDFAAEAGLPDVMAHGMLSAGLLASALTDWFGPGSVLDYAVRFKSPVWPGDILTARCVGIGHAAAGIRDREAELVLELVRNGDEVVLSGTARVALEQAASDLTVTGGELS